MHLWAFIYILFFSSFWDYALTLNVEEVVYLHCHQQEGSGTIVLVGQDGVMQPPIKFPRGGHLLSFLSCLENGLMPYGQLDPPLWSQKGKGMPILCSNALYVSASAIFELSFALSSVMIRNQEKCFQSLDVKVGDRQEIEKPPKIVKTLPKQLMSKTKRKSPLIMFSELSPLLKNPKPFVRVICCSKQ